MHRGDWMDDEFLSDITVQLLRITALWNFPLPRGSFILTHIWYHKSETSKKTHICQNEPVSVCVSPSLSHWFLRFGSKKWLSRLSIFTESCHKSDTSHLWPAVLWGKGGFWGAEFFGLLFRSALKTGPSTTTYATYPYLIFLNVTKKYVWGWTEIS